MVGILHPTFRLQAGSQTLQPAWSDIPISFHCTSSMDAPANSLECMFMLSDTSLRIKEGDDLRLFLGYDTTVERVFTGKVDILETDVSHLRVLGIDSSSKLLSHRVNRLYEKQTAGKIVLDLSMSAGVAVGEVSEGITFPYYVVDDNRSAYEQMRLLADRCGYDFYITEEDKVIFKAHVKGTAQTLEYGKNIIAIEGMDARVQAPAVIVYGESPSSTRGADTSHWLTKREVGAIAGAGRPVMFWDLALRDRDTAEKVAKAKLKKLARTLSVEIRIVGKADVRLGDTVELRELPNASLNGEFQIRKVEHLFSKSKGFITFLGCRTTRGKS